MEFHLEKLLLILFDIENFLFLLNFSNLTRK